MNYEIKILTDEKGNPQLDQFGHVVLNAYLVGKDQVKEVIGCLTYPADVKGAFEFAKDSLIEVINKHKSNAYSPLVIEEAKKIHEQEFITKMKK